MVEEKAAVVACMAGLGFTEDMLLGIVADSQEVRETEEEIDFVDRRYMDSTDSRRQALRNIMLNGVVVSADAGCVNRPVEDETRLSSSITVSGCV
jgi:hypothetical protein